MPTPQWDNLFTLATIKITTTTTAMARNCLRITHQGDTIQLSWQRGQAAPRFADAVTFEHPFNQEALTDLRWYLEEYLRFPYGIFPENAAKIEQKLQNWGEELFQLVFRSSEKGREFFQAATYEGLHNCELAIALIGTFMKRGVFDVLAK
ncbi:MAG: hypothetical protein QNJ36_14965 [Calothrix sp. MO_167.B42]|nr:hypothetical protein [Calothrix sp. MO_167.B42]